MYLREPPDTRWRLVGCSQRLVPALGHVARASAAHSVPAYVDGRRHLKDSIRFFLRSEGLEFRDYGLG